MSLEPAPRSCFPRAAALALLACSALWAGGGDAQPSPQADAVDRPAVRLLPAVGRVEGPTRVEVLAIDREIATLVFYLDGEEAAERKKPPWQAELPFADPAREQTVTVAAFDARDRRLGRDSLVVNPAMPALAVRIETISGDPAAGEPVTVTAKVSVPRKARLEAVRFYRGETLVETRREAPFETVLGPGGGALPADRDFVRAVLELEDGRQVEDVELLASRGFGEELAVNLVQLQTLVTTKRGAPVTDLSREDFEVRQGGAPQTLDRLYLAQDMALVLGVVVDASGSMEAVWDLTVDSVARLLGSSIGPRDRAFLIDFDDQLRLAQPLTGDHGALAAALEALEPEGNTALFDAMLYGLLQYSDEPGRRALVVVTDGIDHGSLADPDGVVDVARRLGVPIYVVAMPLTGAGPATTGIGREAGAIVHTLKLITDPSGGRLIRVRGSEGLARAFAQIALELRSQYVLTYYTEAPPIAEGVGAVDVRIKGRKDLEVRAVLPLDQVQ